MIEPRKLLYAILAIAALIAARQAVTALQADNDAVAFSETIDKCWAVMAQTVDGDAVRQTKAECRPLLRNRQRFTTD